jgi:hypothetical protein
LFKVIAVEAVGSGNRSCESQGRFSPVFSTAFGTLILSLFVVLSFLFFLLMESKRI